MTTRDDSTCPPGSRPVQREARRAPSLTFLAGPRSSHELASAAQTRNCKVLLLHGGSLRAYRAWPLAWPLPSGPLGWQRSPGSTARRRRVPRSGMRSTVEAGGADPDNARRSAAAAVTFPASPQLARGWRPGPRGRARCRVDTAGTARGRSSGPPGAAARRAAGLPPEGRDESCRIAYGAPPALTSAAYGGPL